VHRVAQRLNYDYSKACEVVADQVEIDSVQNLLLHFATALSAGEPEPEFLQRETDVQLELYAKKYERDMESLRKWTDAYIALMVSTTLIVVISLVSMMIYPVANMALILLTFIVMMVTAAGGWVIFAVAPHEVKTHHLRRRSAEQQRMDMLAPLLIVGTGPVLALVWLMSSLGIALIVAAMLLSPLGFLAWVDDKKIDQRDRDLSGFLRGLGSVMGAVGTTVTEGLARLNRRSLGAMEPHVRRLYVRLINNISPELTWSRFSGESGSELVTRSVRIFSESINLGGDPAAVGALSSAFALKISLFRASRALVGTTFAFVIVPMHAALLMILLFVTEVVRVFGAKIAEVQSDNLNSDIVREAGVSTSIAFAAPDMQLIGGFVSVMVLMLTLVNSFAPYAASGGHRFKICLYASVMMVLTGIALLAVPAIVQGLFRSVSTMPS
jgi:flagellar protein FlaJ